MDTMRAAVFHEVGDPSVVVVERRPRPDPGPGEVRIRVRAAALNHLDLWVRRGLPLDLEMPHIGGADMAGEVDAVGVGVPDTLIGTRVVVDPSIGYEEFHERPGRGAAFAASPFRILGEHRHGGLAEYAVVPAENCMQLPDDVSEETAAAASLAGVTAWRAVLGRGRLQPGESVLVTGGSGGVSTHAIQIARFAGARVFAVTSGPDNVSRLDRLGAHHVYDRTAEDWLAALRRDTHGRGVDLVVDSVGAALWDLVLRALARGGRVVCYGATTGPRVDTDLRHIFWKQQSILGTTMGTPAEYRRAMQMVFDGHLRPPIHTVLPLDETRRAHELLEEGSVFGKVVIRPDR